MMGQPGTAEAVELARANPRLQIGWHLHLCNSKPLTRNVWPWGASPAKAGWHIGLSPSARALMRREVAAQWEAFHATGLRCGFVNCHHHLHVHPMVLSALLEVLPGEFDGWMRFGHARFFGADGAKHRAAGFWMQRGRKRCPYRCSDSLWGLDRLFAMNPAEVATAMTTLPGGLHEFMFHPHSPENDADVECLLALRRRGL